MGWNEMGTWFRYVLLCTLPEVPTFDGKRVMTSEVLDLPPPTDGEDCVFHSRACLLRHLRTSRLFSALCICRVLVPCQLTNDDLRLLVQLKKVFNIP